MSHGDHWTALGISHDRLVGELTAAAEQGIETRRVRMPRHEDFSEFTDLFAITDPEGDVRYFSLVGDNDEGLQILSAFPFLSNGYSHLVSVGESREWQGPIEGIVYGSLGPAMIAFFCPYFAFERHKYEEGETMEFNLAALAYHLEVIDEDAGFLVDDPERIRQIRRDRDEEDAETNLEPIKFRFAGARAYMPDEEFVDDSSFMTVIDAVEECEVHGIPLWKLEIGLFVDTSELEDIVYRLPLYAAKSICPEGFSPQVGQPIQGRFWMQGRLVS